MDMSDQTQEAIDAKILYSVVQNPFEQGRRAVQIIADILEKKTSAPFIKRKCKLRIVGALALLFLFPTRFFKKTHCSCNVVLF
jgi:ABC-type sugar transport system substrate-binding protein